MLKFAHDSDVNRSKIALFRAPYGLKYTEIYIYIPPPLAPYFTYNYIRASDKSGGARPPTGYSTQPSALVSSPLRMPPLVHMDTQEPMIERCVPSMDLIYWLIANESLWGCDRNSPLSQRAVCIEACSNAVCACIVMLNRGQHALRLYAYKVYIHHYVGNPRLIEIGSRGRGRGIPLIYHAERNRV